MMLPTTAWNIGYVKVLDTGEPNVALHLYFALQKPIDEKHTQSSSGKGFLLGQAGISQKWNTTSSLSFAYNNLQLYTACAFVNVVLGEGSARDTYKKFLSECIFQDIY